MLRANSLTRPKKKASAVFLVAYVFRVCYFRANSKRFSIIGVPDVCCSFFVTCQPGLSMTHGVVNVASVPALGILFYFVNFTCILS